MFKKSLPTLIAIILSLLFVSVSDAAEYKVIQCGAGISNDQNTLSWNSGVSTNVDGSCASTTPNVWPANNSAYVQYNIYAETATVPEGRMAHFTWAAPGNVTMKSVTARFRAVNALTTGWRLRAVRIASGGAETIDKYFCTDSSSCPGDNYLPAGTTWNQRTTNAAAPAFKRFSVRLICVRVGGCNTTPSEMRMNSLVFTLDDPVLPFMTGLTSNSFTDGSWVKGTQSVSFNTIDTDSGIYQTSIKKNNSTVVASTAGAGCQTYTGSGEIAGEHARKFQPCPISTQTSNFSVDTTAYSSGAHVFDYCSIDFARNERCGSFTANIDNTLPTLNVLPNPGQINGNTLNLDSNAADAHSGVQQVQFKVGAYDPSTPQTISNSLANIFNSSAVCTKTSTPYNCAINTAGYSDNTRIAVLAIVFDNAGNVNAQWVRGPGDAGILIDRTKPIVQIDSHPPAISNNTDAAFTFSANETVTSYSCKIDSGAYTSCTSPKLYTGLTQGAHTFSVIGTDAAGNVSDPAVWNWNVDSVKPVVQIDSHPPALTTSTSANFTFSANESVTYQCRLDGGSWTACSSPQSYTGLAMGQHNFDVRGTDASGNVSDPASWEWDISNLPATNILSGPSNPTNSPLASFTFNSPDGTATFECSLDSGSWEVCSSPKSYSGLLSGQHTFQARAINSFGTGPADTYTWTVDLNDPIITVVSGPPNQSKTNTNSPEFTFTVDEPATLTCRLGTGWLSEAPPVWGGFENCDSGEFNPGPLADGKYTVQIVATDPAGNTDTVNREFIIDTVAPDVTIDSGPTGVITTTTATLTFSSNEDPDVTYQCSLDSGAWEACSSPKTYSGLSQGSHTFRVRGTDEAGNVSETISRSWTVDTVLPDVTIPTKPAENSKSSDAQFVFDSNKDPVTYECSLDSGAWAPCSNPVDFTGLADGTHTLSVRAKDYLNRTGPVTTYTWTIDTTAPTVKINSAPARKTNKTDARLTFSSNEEPVIYQCRLDSSGWKACASPTDYKNLKQGNHVFHVRAIDLAGNVSAPAVWNWSVDAQDRQCKLSYIRARFFVFTAPGKKYQAVRLVARYKAYDAGRVNIKFYERLGGLNLGRKVGKMTVRFKKSNNRFSFFRVRKPMPLKTMQRLRKSKKGFVALVSVQNSPGYCKDAFYKELELSTKRIVQGQNVWFQKGSFK